MMKSVVKGALAAVLLAGTAGIAAAQTAATIDLTPDQRTTVYRSVTRERLAVAPPADFRARVGVEVPAAVELHPFPETIDVVKYRTAPPWPAAGPVPASAIELRDLSLDNDLPESWKPSAGRDGSPGKARRG